MSQPLVEAVRSPGGETILRFQDSLNYRHAKAVWGSAVQILSKEHPQHLILDFSNAGTIDSAGIAVLRLLWRYCRQNHIGLEYEDVPPSAEYFLNYVENEIAEPAKSAALSFSQLVSLLGEIFIEGVRQWREAVRFFGDFVIAAFSSLYHFRHFRWKEMFYYLQISGANAMPIIFVLNLLVGLVMAFQAAIQLRQFGANIFVADLVSLALTRELGPVFTALILAGRSGSAFAAEIGTMKVNEELDALTVMGFDITKFLVLPKVFALAISGPLLTLLANASGILGGIVVGVTSLDLTVTSFLDEMYLALTLMDIATGIIKSFAFAILIALVGCLRGLQTGKGADSVGRQTTSAVVSGSFLIIFADAVFTVLFNVLGW